MLKKRILASSMASVMALSGVSVAAFAEETTAANYGEAVNRDELKKYVDSFEKFIETDLDSYGSKQGEHFSAAIDHAKKVLESSKSTEREFTAAYQMVKSVKEQLVIRTGAELEALINEYKGTYDDNNILNENEDFQDLIYKEDTFAEFTSAYDDATFYVDSEDSRSITDAYVTLYDAYYALEPNEIIKKSEFREVMKDYQDLELEMKKVESWRRGLLTVAPSTGKADDKKKLVSDECVIDMKGLIALVYGRSTDAYAYWKEDGENSKWDNRTSKYKKNNITYYNCAWIGGEDLPRTNNGKSTTDKTFAYTSDLLDDITAQYDRMTEAKGVVETTDKKIVAAYKAAKDAVAVFNGWEKDNYNTGSKASCASVLKKYHGQLVKWARPDVLEAFLEVDYAEKLSKEKETSNTITFSGDTDIKFTYNPVKHTLKADRKLSIAKNEETGFVKETSAEFSVTDLFKLEEEQVTVTDGYTVQNIAAGVDILQYINFEGVTATAAQTKAAAVREFKLAYEHALADKKLLDDFKDTYVDGASDGLNAVDPSSDVGTDGALAGETLSVTITPVQAALMGVNISADKTFNKLVAKTDAGKADVDKHNQVVDDMIEALAALQAYDDAQTTKFATLKTNLENAYKTGGSAGGDKLILNPISGTDGTDAAKVEDKASGKSVKVDLPYIKILNANATTAKTVKEVSVISGQTLTSGKPTDTEHNAVVAALETACSAFDSYYAGCADEIAALKQAYDSTKLKHNYFTAASGFTATTDIREQTTGDDADFLYKTTDTYQVKVEDDDTLTAIGVDATSVTDITLLKLKAEYTELGATPTDEQKAAVDAKVTAHNKVIDQLAKLYKEAAKTPAGDVVFSFPDETTADKQLVKAIKNYKAYLAVEDFDEIPGSTAEIIQGNGIVPGLADGKTIPNLKGSNAEWTLLWRQLAYELDDSFHEAAPSNITLADLKKQIDAAYEAMKLTGDSALFTDEHMTVVEARQEALDWYKEAKAYTGYKSTDSFWYDGGLKTISKVHKDLKDKVDTLNKWYKGFKYSYDDIRVTMNDVAKDLDAGIVSGDALKKALNDTAYSLSTLQPSDVHKKDDSDTNEVFNDERVFQYANRLKTGKEKSVADPTKSEEKLKKDYEKLVELYEAAKKGDQPAAGFDFNGNGKLDLPDVIAELDAFIEGKTDKTYDVNGNGTFELDDVIMLLDAFLAQ